ncbi:MAG: hypothetical protein SVO01_13200 [Thermotogota bacterium]|nr:hypothetical protein [Thermotogota bacterium]
MEIQAQKAFFIKLGCSGSWAEECINNSTLRLGFENPHHQKCLDGDWDFIRNYWKNEVHKTEGKATEIMHQIRNFYESEAGVLWITFHNKKLYWCFSKREITELGDGTRIRPCKESWSCKDLKSNELTIEALSSKLTKTQSFQGTICNVEALDYLKRRLNGTELPSVKRARKAYDELKDSLIDLIKNLTWQDFELLTDLIFSYSGWKRIETLGKTQKSIDLDLMSPVTGKRAFVQVKSTSDLSTFQEYVDQFKNMNQYDEMYFVVHSPKKSLEEYGGDHREKIISVDKIAELSINSGLADWIISKSK